MTGEKRPQSVAIRDAGDSALLLELEAIIDPAINAQAIGIAAAVRRRALVGVRDVVPAFHAVGVFFDPLQTDVQAVRTALHEESERSRPQTVGRTIEVPVVYGGEAGPDLPDVAAFGRCSVADVIDRHASRMYRVYMLGFLPGFAYMASVDKSIAVPRRAAPRVRVPAGSVGIAGLQTGIYPRDSPGGWQIIGRTDLEVFNPDNPEPARFAPGDQVRFVPSSGVGRLACRASHGTPSRSNAAGAPARAITVVRPGLQTTLQDLGRWGFQSLGVPVSGPMDPIAHRLANALVGNEREAATIEATILGPELRFEQDTRVAIAGADLDASIGGADVRVNTTTACHAGDVLRFRGRRSGARTYIAVDGGVATPPVLGSCATHVRSGLGGMHGRALQAGDRIPLGAPESIKVVAGFSRTTQVERLYTPVKGGARLRVLPGPQLHHAHPSALDVLCRTRYVVSPQSDRMGYRLNGASVPLLVGDSMISTITFSGAIQVPSAGEPILLMADRQTSGGYPQVAVVITADLPLAAQLAPGDWVEFEPCTLSEAVAALGAQEGQLVEGR